MTRCLIAIPAILIAGSAWGMVKFLVEHGANTEVKNEEEFTPLALAPVLDYVSSESSEDFARRELASIAEILVERGARLDVKDGFGSTPLHLAARGGRTAVAAVLLAGGASVVARDEDGRTPEDLARENGHAELAETLRRARIRAYAKYAAGAGVAFAAGVATWVFIVMWLRHVRSRRLRGGPRGTAGEGK